MRKIITSNSQIEFQEVSSTGTLLNSIGLQLGEVYFIIKGNKVSFYLNDSEKPFDSYIWSLDIPFYLDDELIENPNDASAALKAIMNDSFQEQLDALQEELATEEGRAQEAEEQLDDKIEEETARAINQENRLQDEITELSGTVATFDGRITRNTNDISALTNTVNDEISRSVAKDASHDAQISGLTNTLNSEIQRALSAETNLHNEIINEQNRAIAKENQIDAKIDNEISRSTAKDASHDSLISGLTTSLQSEINRATEAENSLRTDLNAEITRATNAENALDAKIDAEIRDRINAISGLNNSLNAEITRSTSKDASQDALISGLSTSLQNEINRSQGAENSLRSDLNDEVSARTSADSAMLERIVAVEVGKANKSDLNNYFTKAESDAKYPTKDYISGLTSSFFDDAVYDKNTKRINFYNGNAILTYIDATDFIKDGMVDNVAISGSNLVITFNTDSGKEPISIPLSSIFDPSNYYTKNEVDSALSGKVDVSVFNTLSGRVDTISGDVVTVSGAVETVKQEIVTISGDSYSKSEIDTKLGNKADLSAFTAHTANTTIHVTAQDKTNWNNKSDFSGDYNDLTNKPTIPSLDGYATQAWVSGFTYDKQTIDDKIAQGGTFDPTQYYNKTQTNALLDLKADTANTYTKSEVNGLVADKADTTAVTQVNNVVTAHTASTSIHVTSSEKQLWNNKSDFSGSYNDLTNKPTIPNYSAGTGIDITNDVISVTGGTEGITSAQCQTLIDNSISGKTNQSDFSAHTANTTVHVTAAEKSTWNNKSDFSGSYNDLTNKPTIPNYTAGTGIDITNNVISAKIWSGTKAQFEALTTKDADTIYLIYNS